MVIRRGEVWWADLAGSAGWRPVLVLSRDVGIRVRSKITIAPITTNIRDIPTEVKLGLAEGLPRESVADLDSLHTIPKTLLRERIASLSSGKLTAVEEAIRFALDLR